MEFNTSMLLHLARGGHLRIDGFIIAATRCGKLRRQKDNSNDRRIVNFWQRMELHHNIDSKEITHDPFGYYTEMLKKAGRVARCKLFGVSVLKG